METKTIVMRHWDDVVFENRNKDYGAYTLRKAYAQRVMLGLGLSIAMFASLLMIPTIASFFTGAEVVKPIDPLVGIIKITEVILPQREVKPRASTTSRLYNKKAPVQVVKEEVKPVEEVKSKPDDNYGTLTGTPGGEDVPITSTGTGTTIEPVVAVTKPDEVLINAEFMPVYDGGREALMKFIQKKIHYPAVPRRMGIDGTVYVSFVVRGDGSVTNVQVLKGIHEDCDKEAMRVISLLPAWKGGKQNGNPVSVRMVLPIKFNLDR
jgi:protein TonB